MRKTAAALLTTLLLAVAAAEPPPRVEDLPPLSDLGRFPPRAVVQGWIDFADAHVLWLDGRLEFLDAAGLRGCPERERLAGWRCDALSGRAPWARLLEAQDETRPEWLRRHSLDCLRHRLSWERYYAGRLPPPVPLEYFDEVP